MKMYDFSCVKIEVGGQPLTVDPSNEGWRHNRPDVMQELVKKLRSAPQPSAELVIALGIIRSKCYSTVRYGRVTSFAGEGEFEMEDGRRFAVRGYSSEGTAGLLQSDGYIEIFPL